MLRSFLGSSRRRHTRCSGVSWAQAEDGIRDAQESRGLGDVYKRQVLSCAPLLGCALRPGIPITLALLAVSGMGTAFQLAANAAFVQAVPAAVRGQVFGLAQAGIITVQGAAILLAGAVASRLAPALVVAGAGGLGTAAAARLIWSLSRADRAAAGRWVAGR